MECKKCKNTGTTVIRKTDYYCEDCFVKNTNHKFRASIGKNKILSKYEKVLVCLSGGPGSTVLLHLISNGLSMDNHKKLRIVPSFMHVMGTGSNSVSVSENVIKNCSEYNFNVYIVPISQYMGEVIDLPKENSIPPVNNDLESQFTTMLHNNSITSVNDFLPIIKKHLYFQLAKKLKCNFIFTAETTTTLAINLLSNLALGRGSQVQHNVGFCDARDKNIRILRPMKDITAEELNKYIMIEQLHPVYEDQINTINSIQSVIGGFVLDLQENFPATISTVCKTAEKIGIHKVPTQNQRSICVICKGEICTTNLNHTALEATIFSRTVSNKNSPFVRASSNSYLEDMDNHTDKTLFPYIQDYLCYTCSKHYSESDGCDIPTHLKNILQQ